MSGWTRRALGSVATIERLGLLPDQIPDGTKYLGLENISRGGTINSFHTIGEVTVASTKFSFTDRHILYGKLRPNLGKIARPAFAGVCSTDILPVLPGPEVDRNYLANFLAQPDMVEFAASRAAGANLPRLSPTELARFEVPLPPIEEQRRIAAILDQADELRVKRREALALLDDLTQSIFIDMFGPGPLPTRPLGELVTGMRNGLSPSTKGTARARVLTLSAVTRGSFDPSAAKNSVFDHEPPPEQRVSAKDLLICRGNGNLAFVGAGVVAGSDHRDLVFPDTIIAARLDESTMDTAFAEVAWRQARVRAQIESLARTTSGIHKVSQGSLREVQVAAPPLTAQAEFRARLGDVHQVRADAYQSLSSLEQLFASLQARAFAGRL